MAVLKDAAENAAVVVDSARNVRKWVARSTPKVLLVLALVGVILIGGQALYLTYQLNQYKDATSVFTKTTRLLGEKLAYEVAIDSISSCLESKNGAENLHVWYCEQADTQFKLRTDQLKYPGARQMFDMRAYLAMGNLMRSRVRGLALARLTSPAETTEGKLFSLAVSKIGTVVVTSLTALLLLAVLGYLAWPPRRHHSE